MPMPRNQAEIVRPTVEIAFERIVEWPVCWLVYGDDSVGWKDLCVSHVFLRIDGLRHLVGDERYREYQVRAVKIETAIDRAVELVQCPYELSVTVYKVTLPPTAEMVGFLEAENARIQRDPAWGAFRRKPRCLGTRSRQHGSVHLPAARGRRVSCGL